MEWIECFLLFVVKTNYSANYIHSARIYLLSRPCGIPNGEVGAVFDAEGVGVFPAPDRGVARVHDHLRSVAQPIIGWRDC